MTTATQLSELPAIEYPDSDGLPMSDNTLQNDWMFKIKGGLSALFALIPMCSWPAIYCGIPSRATRTHASLPTSW